MLGRHRRRWRARFPNGGKPGDQTSGARVKLRAPVLDAHVEGQAIGNDDQAPARKRRGARVFGNCRMRHAESPNGATGGSTTSPLGRTAGRVSRFILTRLAVRFQQLGKLFMELAQLRRNRVLAIGLVRIARVKFLVVVLRRIEFSQRFERRHHRILK